MVFGLSEKGRAQVKHFVASVEQVIQFEPWHNWQLLEPPKKYGLMHELQVVLDPEHVRHGGSHF